MATFDVKVWATQDVIDEHGNTPQEVAREYINQAITLSEHDGSVSIGNTYPNPPYECRDWTDANACTGDSSGEYAGTPCSDKIFQYDGLGEWWRKYAQCHLDPPNRDCDMLLSNYPSFAGVTLNNRWAVVEGANYLDTLDPNNAEAYLKGDDGNAAQTVLHELAHALIDLSNEHNLGNTDTHNSELYRSPMCPPGPGDKNWEGENDCQNDYSDAPDENWKEFWSECCEMQMENIFG